ncbi:biotin--[acetyl-CoA-carboxylase] ligase [Pontimonas sp.]|nr:biotin--[acetyl-CoA-carboxylase] ligase [Pontimonas sp.]
MTKPFAFPRTAALVPSLLDLQKVESTNTALGSLARAAGFSVALSANQTKGRGRHNRQWESTAGEALAVSVLVPSAALNSAVFSWVPLLVGLAVVRSVLELGLGNARLKWPNDVLVGDKKLAGILCEVLPSGAVVAGVGINLFFSSAPPVPRATALGSHIEFQGSTPDVFVARFVDELRRLVGTRLDTISSDVSSAMETLHRAVEVLETDGSRWSGYARGLDNNGRLILRTADGEHRTVSAGDIEHLYQ